jgi:hypothetical protein
MSRKQNVHDPQLWARAHGREHVGKASDFLFGGFGRHIPEFQVYRILEQSQ